MTLRIAVAGTLLAMAGFLAIPDNARAQGSGSAPKCYPNFIQQCTKVCIARGGQPRLCPQYCQNEKRDRGCK